MSNEPQKRTPDGVDVNWVTQEINWPFPTWIGKELYDREFADSQEGVAARRLIDMFNDLGVAIDKSMATDAADQSVIGFKYWRKLSSKATKMKPTKLVARLFAHPDYDRLWLLVEYAQ
jgi:hypothetical protein